tara:strand:- start:717 stop:989 length:273 start_codon:yes stop_codon:yes gene_type:complete
MSSSELTQILLRLSKDGETSTDKTATWDFTAGNDDEAIEEIEQGAWFCDSLAASDPTLWHDQFYEVFDVVVKKVTVTVTYEVVKKDSDNG